MVAANRTFKWLGHEGKVTCSDKSIVLPYKLQPFNMADPVIDFLLVDCYFFFK